MEGFALRVLQRRVEDKALEDAVSIAAVSVLVGQDQRVTAQLLDAQNIKVDHMFIQISVVPPDIDIVIDASAHGSGEGGVEVVAVVADFRNREVEVGLARAE